MASQTQPRIHAKPEELVPLILVRVMFGLVGLILVIVSIATFTGREPDSQPPAGAIIAQRAIHLSGDASGAARVLDETGTVIADFASDKGGFVAGIERVIARERGKSGADTTAPVLLQLREGNRLSLNDPVTGWSAELMGFGASNTRTFARLLVQP
ncbi:photosynthetic complex assembly protein PuhC [uncultured Roseobacter sp.]|uniref:photosynthetic complex assembly protein PuhC n=1 Tax=uncultured Roseobacter sp. TaxID=114847 RepID=UPI0026360042|nr:photosynthetic complex assembly protein PuhC [uncultured Roseobacter sp.]